MNYIQSILWLILSALCMVQFVTKFPRQPWTPVNFRYESYTKESFAEFMRNVNEAKGPYLKFDRTIERFSSQETEFKSFAFDAPYTLKAGEPFNPEFDPITTEIKINGAIVRKGKTTP